MSDQSDQQSNEPDISEADLEAAEEELTLEKEGEQPKDTIKRLREDLKECTAKKQEYLSGWQRAKADLVNAKKEFDRERDRIEQRTVERVVQDLLPALDSFRAAMNEDGWSDVDKEWRTGVEAIYAQITSALESQDVAEIDPDPGDAFDPQLHASADAKPADDEHPDNTIAEVEKIGYRRDDRIIRSAQVVIYSDDADNEQVDEV